MQRKRQRKGGRRLQRRILLRDLGSGLHTFQARFIKLGHDHQSGQKTVLLRRVRLGTIEVADHLWVKCTGKVGREGWKRFQSGDMVELVAQPTAYLKGRPHDELNPQRIDWTLAGIQSVKPLGFRGDMQCR